MWTVLGISGGCALALTFSVPRMTEWETAAPAVAETPDIKLFGKWSTDDVQINDISLQVRGGGVVVVPPARGWGAHVDSCERGPLKLEAVQLNQELKT